MASPMGVRSRLVTTVAAAGLIADLLVGSTPAVAGSPSPSAGDPTASAAPSGSARSAPAPTPTSVTSPSPEPTPGGQLKPGASEITSARTDASTTYDNHDGTLTTDFYTQPVYYKPGGSGAFVPIEVGFAPNTKGGDAVAVSDKAPVAVTVAPAAAAHGFLRFGSDGHTVSFGLPADARSKATTIDPATDGRIATYANFLPGVDLRVIAGATGAKSFFAWREAPKDPSLTFSVEAPGLTLTLQDDGSIGFFDAAGKLVGRMPRPFAVDSTPNETLGSGLYTDKVSYTLAKDGASVTVAVDPTWLKTATYPVYIDPTWANAGSSSYGDAHIASNYPSTNFDNYVRPDSPYYHELWLGDDPSGTSGTSYDYLRWNLSSIVGTTIDSATIDIYPYHQYYNAPTSTKTWLALVTTSWTETQPTWNNKPGSNATNQVNANCVEATTCTFNVLAYTQGWANGTANYGIKLWENGNGSTYWKRLISAEEGGSHVEHMSVTYHTPVATVVSPTGATGSRTLTWAYTDSSGHAQTNWEAAVASDAGFTNILTNGSWSGTGIATSTAIPANVTLVSGTTYFWRVRVKDGTSWSPYASTSFSWDNGPPTLSSFIAPSTPTAATSLAYTLTFSEPVSGLAAGDFAITGTATGWSVSSITGSGPYTVSLGSGTAGTVILTLNANTVSDGAANTGPASASTATTVTVDRTAPVGTFTIPANTTTQAATQVVVTWSEVELGSGVASRSLQQRRMVSPGDGTCLGFSWANDGAASSGVSPTTATSLSDGWCYRWTLTLTDVAGNSSVTTSSTVLVDAIAPTANFTTPDEGTTTTIGSGGSPLAWTENDASSGIAGRALQRQRTTFSGGTCDTTWTVDGSPTNSPSPTITTGLALTTCYRWVLTLTDAAGNSAQITSGTIRIGDSILDSPIASQNVFALQPLIAETALPSVTNVEFLVDGATVASDASAPYVVQVDTASMSAGPHQLQIKVTQSGGATTTTSASTVTVANNLGPGDRIASDFAVQTLSLDAYVIDGVYATVAPNALPIRYQSNNPNSGAQTLGTYLVNRDQLQQVSKDELDAFMAQPLSGDLYQPTANLGQAEPNYDGCGLTNTTPAGRGGYPSFTVTYCETSSSSPTGSHFKFVYVIGVSNTAATVERRDDGVNGGVAGNRIPDFVDQTAAELEDAYAFYVSALGFSAPLSGSDQITIGLNAAGGSGNLASKDLFGLGGIKLNLNPGDVDVLTGAAPHELFHAFEYGYRDAYFDTGYFEREFWYEATANWGAHKYVDYHRSVDPAFAPKNGWTGDLGAYFSTTESELSAMNLNHEERQYAVSFLAQYLDEQFPTTYPVRRTWELIASGQTAKQAIATAVAEQPSVTFAGFLQGYAQTAYQLSLGDPDLAAWIVALKDYTSRPNGHPVGNPLYVGPDAYGKDRPLRHLAIASPTADVTGEIDLGEEGMGYVDVDPQVVLSGQNGTVSVRVLRPDENVQARIVAYKFVDPNDPQLGTLPCGSDDLVFTGSEGYASVSIDGLCRFATIIIDRSGPSSFSLFGSKVKWSASAWLSQG